MFIKLTGFKNNSTVMPLVSQIIALDGAASADGVAHTEISLEGAPNVLFAVKETPEQIMEMISRGFVPKSGSMKPEPPKRVLTDEFGNVINENGDDRKC